MYVRHCRTELMKHVLPRLYSPAPALCRCCHSMQIVSGTKGRLCGRAISSAMTAGKGHLERDDTIWLHESLLKSRVLYRSTQYNQLYIQPRSTARSCHGNLRVKKQFWNIACSPADFARSPTSPRPDFCALGYLPFPPESGIGVPAQVFPLPEGVSSPEGDPTDVRSFYEQCRLSKARTSGTGVMRHILLCFIENAWVSLAAIRRGPRIHSSLSAHQHSGVEHQPRPWPNLLGKPLLPGVVPHCGHRSSQEQSGKLWMAKDVRVLSRKRRSAQIPHPPEMMAGHPNG